MNACLNCGRTHTGRLVETFKDGNNKPIDIVVCEHPRYAVDYAKDYPDGYSTVWRNEGQIDGTKRNINSDS